MAKDILSEYGADHTAPKHSPGSSGVTTDGGKPYNNPSMCYCPPIGPSNLGYESPGNHGVNHGNKGSQGSH